MLSNTVITAMNAIYRCSRREVWILRVGIPLGLLFTCVLIIPARDAPHPLGITLIGLLPLLFVVGCIYSLLFLKHHQLIVSDSQVEYHGIRTKHQVVFDDVHEAGWQLYAQAGRLTLKTSNGTLAINFNNYDADAQRTLIRFFRFRLDQAGQSGWDAFWSTRWRLFDVQESADTVVQERHKRIHRRRTDVTFLVGFVLALETVAIVLWLNGRAREIALLPLLLPLWWLMRRSFSPPLGKVSATPATCESAYSQADIFLAAAAVLFAVAAPTGVIFTMLDLPGTRVALLIATCAPLLLAFAAALWHARQMPRQREEAARLARMAEEEYMVPLPGQESRW